MASVVHGPGVDAEQALAGALRSVPSAADVHPRSHEGVADLEMQLVDGQALLLAIATIAHAPTPVVETIVDRHRRRASAASNAGRCRRARCPRV